jgi:dTDP-4-dehydrorhamnose reductase
LPVRAILYTRSRRMRILVTGKSGQVGTELGRLYRSPQEAIFTGREECDLGNEQSIRETVRRLKPEVILNAGAYTAVDQAETDRDLCFRVNAVAPGVLAQEAARLNALLIHYSTDYVFNGQKTEPYRETDAVDPINIYGASKAAGETAIVEAGARAVVLRTTWVYGAHGKNFLRTMLRVGAERPELRVVDDQVGAPTSAAAIAEATRTLAERFGRDRDSIAPGIYHMTAGGSTTWYGFAQAIFAGSDLEKKPRVEPIPSSAYKTPAQRPANSVLANDKFAQTFGFRMSGWQQQLDEVFATMTETKEVQG